MPVVTLGQVLNVKLAEFQYYNDDKKKIIHFLKFFICIIEGGRVRNVGKLWRLKGKKHFQISSLNKFPTIQKKKR